MKRVLKKTVAAALAAAMVLSLAPANGAEAAKKKSPSLSKKKTTLTVGKSIKLKVKNGNKKAKVSWKIDKKGKKAVKIAKKSSKGKSAYAKVTAVKKGKATVTASYKLGKKTKKLNCKITVKAKGSSTTPQGGTPTAPAAGTVAPVATAPGGGTTGTVPPTVTDAGQATDTPEETVKPTRSPKPPTALPKNSAVEAHKLGKGEEVVINGAVDKWANGAEWENTTDKEIDLLANKEVSLRGTSTITAAKAFLMWADETDNGENALYAIVKVTKPGTVGSSDKVTLFLSEDGTKIEKAEAVVGADATANAAAAASKATDLGGVDGYIAELKIPLSKAYAVDTDKLKIDIMISDGDATINYFDTMTEFELKKDDQGNVMVDENNRNIAVPSGPAVSVDKDASKMGDAALIASMAAAAKAYKTASGAAIREAADYENSQWDWEIPATPDPSASPNPDATEAPAPTDNGIKSKAMKFVDTKYWTDVYKANESESIAFPNVNVGGYNMDGNITLADKVEGEEGGWEASREKVQSYIIWDDGYVYVLFDVNDPKISDSASYDGDSVEFFLDQDYSAPKSYATDGTGDEVQLRVDAANNQFSANDAGTGAYELVAHAVAYKGANGAYVDAYNSEGVTGYQVEMIIKLQNDDKHPTPKDGDIMGMDLQINDAYMKYEYEEVEDEFGDKYEEIVPGSGVVTRAGTITAFDTTNNCYQDPSCFGRIKLLAGVEGGGDEPGPGPEPGLDADVEARFTSATITIDGEKEAAWNSAPALKVANAIPGGVDEKTPATARLLWDAENLYVLVTVKDADIDTSAADDYKRDGGEVFLDEDNSKEETYDANTDAFQYRFTGMAKDGSGATTHGITAGSATAQTDYAGIESAYKVIKNKDDEIAGYQIEHKIPWKATPEVNKIVGFELNVFDCSEGERNKEYYLINTESKPLYNNPSHMGTLKLVESVATLPYSMDLSQIQISEDDGSTMTVEDDGSVTIVNGGKNYTGGITLNMPAKFDGTPKKCTVYVDTYDSAGTKMTGGQFMWAGNDNSTKYNWGADTYSDVVLDIAEDSIPETLVLNFQPPDSNNYPDAVTPLIWKISKIVVE